jgi:hypothetical protein
MISFRKKLVTVAGMALAAMAFALPASAATASASGVPAVTSTYNCNPNPLASVSECTRVINHGLKVKSVSGHTTNLRPIPISGLHIEIYGPSGKIKNCGQFTLRPLGTSPVCTWHNPHPNKNVRKGNYCSRVWQKIGPGNYVDLSNECDPVSR